MLTKKEYEAIMKKAVEMFVGLPGTHDFNDAAYDLLAKDMWDWDIFNDLESSLKVLHYSNSVAEAEECFTTWRNLPNELIPTPIRKEFDVSISGDFPGYVYLVGCMALWACLEDCRKLYNELAGIKNQEDEEDRKMDIDIDNNDDIEERFTGIDT
jgi:hypothetical protein